MTAFIPDEPAFKRAAKALAGTSGAGSLSACQTALAKAIGFRDFHQYQAVSANVLAATPVPTRIRIEIVRNLGESIETSHGDIIDALITARLFDRDPDPSEALRLREELFALRYPVVGRFSAGTPCRLTPGGSGRGERALLVKRGEGPHDLSRAMTDHAISTCVSHELPAHRAGRFFIPLRFWMPYGVWTEADGTKVLFSRDYCPLWKIAEGRAPVRDDPDRAVSFIRQEWFFSETSFRGPVDRVAEQGHDILRKHRVVSTPRLVEWLPECLEQGVWISSLKRWPWDRTSPRSRAV